MNELRLYSSVKNVDIDNMKEINLELAQGVPGCGKTTFIVNAYEEGDLILFPTREGASDFRLRLKREYPKYDPISTNDSCRTVHSFLINSTDHLKRGGHYKRLIMDEALMLHAVRTSRTSEDIYESLPHCTVAISRHTESFVYVTPVRDDTLGKWVRMTGEYSDEVLSKHSLSTVHPEKQSASSALNDSTVNQVKQLATPHDTLDYQPQINQDDYRNIRGRETLETLTSYPHSITVFPEIHKYDDGTDIPIPHYIKKKSAVHTSNTQPTEDPDRIITVSSDEINDIKLLRSQTPQAKEERPKNPSSGLYNL
ncbi:hypothetical protein J6590_057869 [Homalodisca vitripennis]|nr:hypothetical protein J6590_057869 [Homalodisca vitripennis]